MKTVKRFILAAAFFIFPLFSFAQDHNTKDPITQSTKKTFSVEINCNNTVDELAQIEKMLNDDYNISLTFKDVKVVDGKIIALKMKLRNGTQSFTKSVENINVPIDPFTIHIEDRGQQQYHVTVEHHDEEGITSFMQFRNSGIFDSFTSDKENTDFSDLNRQMELMIKDLEATRQKFLQLFNNLENTTEIKENKQLPKQDPSDSAIYGTNG